MALKPRTRVSRCRSQLERSGRRAGTGRPDQARRTSVRQRRGRSGRCTMSSMRIPAPRLSGKSRHFLPRSGGASRRSWVDCRPPADVEGTSANLTAGPSSQRRRGVARNQPLTPFGMLPGPRHRTALNCRRLTSAPRPDGVLPNNVRPPRGATHDGGHVPDDVLRIRWPHF
jgi:hypothetical protein